MPLSLFYLRSPQRVNSPPTSIGRFVEIFFALAGHLQAYGKGTVFYASSPRVTGHIIRQGPYWP